MTLEIVPISVSNAVDFMVSNGHSDAAGDPPGFAIGVADEKKLCGAIIMKTLGDSCSLFHLYTDGTALVGSILYGAAWRAAKALGYKQITI